MKKLAVLFIAVAALLTLTSSISTAKQSAPQVAQETPKDAVKAAPPEANVTPDKYKPLIGKWIWNANPRLVSAFEVKSILQNDEAPNLNYVVGGRATPGLVANVPEEDGKLKISIPLENGTWKLTYSSSLGGVLDGEIYVSGVGTIRGQFYREK